MAAGDGDGNDVRPRWERREGHGGGGGAEDDAFDRLSAALTHIPLQRRNEGPLAAIADSDLVGGVSP